MAVPVMLAVTLAIAWPKAALGQSKPFQFNGINFPLIGSNYLDDLPGWTPIPTVIEQLKALGADEVKVTITVGGYNSPTDNLPDPAYTALLRPSDTKISNFLQQLRASGLRVLLNPIVNIKFDTSGNLLDTSHSQPSDFSAWITAHTTDMVQMARLAQQVGVERFSVLTDIDQLLTLDKRNQDGWLSMIAQIREVYAGSLTSMFHEDGTIFSGCCSVIDLTQKPIIDALDILGFTWAPRPLTNTPDPTLDQLVSAWRASARGVDSVAFFKRLHDKYKKPIYITGISFNSFSGDNVNSSVIFDAAVPLVADQQEQANEYDSFLYVMSRNKEDWLLGVAFNSWNRFPTDYPVARFLNSAYGENIRGKLAETVLSRWYRGSQTGLVGLTNVLEYHNAQLDHYFITWHPDEIAKLDAGTAVKGWTRTGRSFPAHIIAKTESSPVCRYYIPPGLGDSHFFGRGETECATTGHKNPTFVLEDATFMHMFLPTFGACGPGTAEVYRVFDNRPDANHRYMTDKGIRDAMVAKGWIAEGDGPNRVVMCAPQ